jgi:hypothetical protein
MGGVFRELGDMKLRWSGDYAVGNRVDGYAPCKFVISWDVWKVGERSLTSAEEKGEGSSLEGKG